MSSAAEPTRSQQIPVRKGQCLEVANACISLSNMCARDKIKIVPRTLALLLTSPPHRLDRVRGRIQLQSDDGIHLLTRSEGHEEFDAAIGLRKAYLAARQHRRADNLCRDRWQQELALRPFQDVDVYRPVSPGRDSVVAWQKGAAAGRINALAIDRARERLKRR